MSDKNKAKNVKDATGLTSEDLEKVAGGGVEPSPFKSAIVGVQNIPTSKFAPQPEPPGILTTPSPSKPM